MCVCDKERKRVLAHLHKTANRIKFNFHSENI